MSAFRVFALICTGFSKEVLMSKNKYVRKIETQSFIAQMYYFYACTTIIIRR